MNKPRPMTLTVRRWGEDEETPVVLNNRKACGTGTDHTRRGCIGLSIEGGGLSGLVHLSNDEALRLADLLYAMADSNGEAS